MRQTEIGSTLLFRGENFFLHSFFLPHLTTLDSASFSLFFLCADRPLGFYFCLCVFVLVLCWWISRHIRLRFLFQTVFVISALVITYYVSAYNLASCLSRSCVVCAFVLQLPLLLHLRGLLRADQLR